MDIKEQKIWSVYVHIFPNGKKYVGITSKPVNKRWANGHGYKGQLVGRAIEKYGWENIQHDILKEKCEFDEAAKLQSYYIQKFKSDYREFGYNLTTGGQGYTKPDHTKIYKYSITGKFIKEFQNSKVAKMQDKISDESFYSMISGRTKSSNGFIYTTAYSGETIEPIEYIVPPKLYLDQPVSAYDKTGRKVKTFYDSSDITKELGILPRDVLEVCNGNRFTSGGYVWRYGVAEKIQLTKHEIDRIGLRKKIYQYSFNGNFIAQYDSIVEAQSKTGVDAGSISTCARGKYKQAGGYIWRYKYEGKKIDHINTSYLGVPVYKYGLDGSYIDEYPSLNNAARANGIHYSSIRQCCESNLNKEKKYSTMAKGFIWSYQKEQKVLPSRINNKEA